MPESAIAAVESRIGAVRNLEASAAPGEVPVIEEAIFHKRGLPGPRADL